MIFEVMGRDEAQQALNARVMLEGADIILIPKFLIRLNLLRSI